METILEDLILPSPEAMTVSSLGVETEIKAWTPYYYTGLGGVISVIRTNSYIVQTDDVLLPDYSVFLSPNPCMENLSLEIKKEGVQATGVQIYDVLGRVIVQMPLSAEQSKWNIPMQQLPTGTYHLVCTTSAGLWSGKFVKISK
ncbi:MAG: T9SS type A sorting domain-containing protein [Saprospiraceae bacterium]|nr:T9SS type A sorting domain-containing protein [Saprospiraceae bacterium]